MPMFEPSEALDAYREFLAARGLDEATLSVRDGFEAMLDFYNDMRASGCAFEEADMLLYQWGNVDPDLYPRVTSTGIETGIVARFYLDLTRQLILHERSEDDDIWQLRLTFDFEPRDDLKALGTHNKWCHSLQEVPQFRDYVLASTPFTVCSQQQIRRTTLEYDRAG